MRLLNDEKVRQNMLFILTMRRNHNYASLKTVAEILVEHAPENSILNHLSNALLQALEQKRTQTFISRLCLLLASEIKRL